MKVVDRLVLAFTRRSRRRRREIELGSREVPLPELPGYCQPETVPGAHTAARSAAGARLARRWSLRMALAAVVVAGCVGLQAYLGGAASGSAEASEEADWREVEEAAASWSAAQGREASALDAAVAAYSAERDAAGAALPEDVAAERIREERPALSHSEVDEELDGGLTAAMGSPTPAEEAAAEMWVWEPPATQTAREAILAYEAASEAADAAEADHEVAFEGLR